MAVQHFQDKLHAVPLRGNGAVRIHQVAGIQQDTPAGIPDAFQQTDGVLRLRQRKPGPPLVFHQEYKGPLGISQQEIDEFRRGVDNLSIGVEPAIGVILLDGYIGDMEHHIGGIQCGGPPEIRLVQGHKRFRRPPAVVPFYSVHAAELRKQPFSVLPIEVQPIREEGQVIANQQILREIRRDILAAPDALDAVQPQGGAGPPQALPAAVFFSCPITQRQVHTLAHAYPSSFSSLRQDQSAQRSTRTGVRQRAR